jgi:hypothetical protein
VENNPGPIALLGSGETSLVGGRIFEDIAQGYPQPLRIAILETPAGFELNSARVAGRVGEFMGNRLRNYKPQIDVIPARRLDGLNSTNNPSILTPLYRADLIFMGPGSPTYAVRHLKDSLAWDLVRLRNRRGAALVFASAAAIAAGAYVLPVYEIFKVGQDVGLVPGLDLFADFNLPLSIIPHWNNSDGGDEVDTSRSFVGLERFSKWRELLPSGHITIGLDEHTGMIIDFYSRNCSVSGIGSVTRSQTSETVIYPAGAIFPIAELGDICVPRDISAGISAQAWKNVESTEKSISPQDIPEDVAQLVEKRRQARLDKAWSDADALRRQIAAMGWIVQDTPEGQVVIRQP